MRRRLLGLALLLAAQSLRAQAGDDEPDSLYIRHHYAKRVARVAMRDGVALLTVVYAPNDASPAHRYPILLQRTPFSVAPYDADAYPATLGPDRWMLRDGYVFAMQEVRGRYLSGGTFENVRPPRSSSRATDESTDAYDTIEWLLRNVAGNSGKVGLFGISYGGFYAAAAELSRHPAIVASSLQAPVMDFWFEDFHHNGALVQGHLYTYPIFGTPRPTPTATHWWLPELQRASARATENDYADQLALGPLANVTRDLYPHDTWWRSIVAHPDYDAFWRARAMPPRLRGITHPVLLAGGWFDAENLYGTLAAYRALRTFSPAANVALVMGPFAHRGWTERDVVHTTHGDLWFGDSLAMRFQRDVQAPFFRRHLKGDTTARAPATMLFDTGRKRWAAFDAWPSRAATTRTFWLHADGTLRDTRPTAGRAFTSFTSDPRTPVPSRCTGPTIEDGALVHYMSDDQRCVTARADVATFRTPVLARDVTIAGPLTARIALRTTGTDADVVVKLVDVYPADEPSHPYQRDTSVHLAGYEQLVRGEIMRARYRRSFSTPVPLRAGEFTEVTVTLPDVFHTFRAGHRVMVQVQGSWFPLFDRNPQRFVRSIYAARARDFFVARHDVGTGRAAASRLDATVIP